MLAILVIGTSTPSYSRRIFLGLPSTARLLRRSDGIFCFGVLIGLFEHLLDRPGRLASALASGRLDDGVEVKLSTRAFKGAWEVGDEVFREAPPKIQLCHGVAREARIGQSTLRPLVDN